MGIDQHFKIPKWPLKILFSSLSLKPQCKHCHNLCLNPILLNHAQLWVLLNNIIIINVFSWVVLLLLLITIINLFWNMGLQFKIIVLVKGLFEDKIWMANAQGFFLWFCIFFLTYYIFSFFYNQFEMHKEMPATNNTNFNKFDYCLFYKKWLTFKGFSCTIFSLSLQFMFHEHKSWSLFYTCMTNMQSSKWVVENNLRNNHT